MSIETIEGIEDIKRDDENDSSEDQQEKKFRIHLPIKQVSTSSFGSRRSSVIGFVPGKSNIAEEFNKASEKFKSFSVIKEKRKLRSLKQDARKKTKRKTSKKKNSKKAPTANIKATSDNEDFESEPEPDVSEIVLNKPKISVVIQEAAEDSNLQAKEEIKALMKKRKKGKKKGRLRKRRRGGKVADPVAEELEKLLLEKDRLLQEELAKLDPKIAPSKPDSSFFPAPKSLEKRRCYFHRGAKALKCTVCSGGENIRLLLLLNISAQSTTEPSGHSDLISGFWPRLI